MPTLEGMLQAINVPSTFESAEMRSQAYESALSPEAWRVIQRWNSEILLSLGQTLADGKYGFFPECIVQGYLDQNDIPKAVK